MLTDRDENETAIQAPPAPRLVSEHSRLKRPEPLQSDFPVEAELGWKRFVCRGNDNLILPGGLRAPRCGAFPTHYILAPDVESAWSVYVEAIAEELETHSRKPEHLQRVIVALDD
jgi:hypothetical protein